jgi:uncharacterized protein YndB with AHSA1/START domain
MSTSQQQETRQSSGDFHHRFELAAPIEAVYEAIATPDGVRGWWTADADIATEVGGVSRVRFGGAGWTNLRVDRLDRPHRIEWACVAQDNPNFTPSDEWMGTTISFELSEIEGGTGLQLTHHGLTSLNCIDVCESGWRHHVGQSLKKLVERGERLQG